MKLDKNKILVNVSRGPVVDNMSLLTAIKKRNFQIGFDVFEEEPINKKSLKILRNRSSILSSHNAFNTKEEVDFVHENTVKFTQRVEKLKLKKNIFLNFPLFQVLQKRQEITLIHILIKN